MWIGERPLVAGSDSGVGGSAESVEKAGAGLAPKSFIMQVPGS